MSKPAANPFFEVDFSKLPDFSKMSGDFKTPFNMEPMMASHRRNIEAATAVAQAACESIQCLAQRQAEMMRQAYEQTTSLFSTMMSSPASPEEKMMRQAEASKAAVEKCIANMREVSETVSKCNTQAMNVVTNRMNEGIEELRGMMKSRKEVAA